MKNIVILVGNVGKEPEIKQWDDGVSVTCSLATTEKWTDKTTKEAKEKTEWHRLVVQGPTAKHFGEFVKKGSRLLIEGSISYRKYTKQGSDEERTITEIKVKSWQLLDRKSDSAQAEQAENANSARPF